MNAPNQAVLKPHIAMLIVLSAIGPVALNIFLPSMPNLTESLSLSLIHI